MKPGTKHDFYFKYFYIFIFFSRNYRCHVVMVTNATLSGFVVQVRRWTWLQCGAFHRNPAHIAQFSSSDHHYLNTERGDMVTLWGLSLKPCTYCTAHNLRSPLLKYWAGWTWLHCGAFHWNPAHIVQFAISDHHYLNTEQGEHGHSVGPFTEILHILYSSQAPINIT